MTLSEMKERKKELGYSYEQIADMSGVPLSTVQKVFSGATQSPRYDTLLAIEKVLKNYTTILPFITAFLLFLQNQNIMIYMLILTHMVLKIYI